MKASKTPKALSRQVSLHHKVQQKAAALVKVAEAAHAEHRKAKAAYKAAKKAARSAKLAWHRARVLAREGQSTVNKSAKRLAKSRGQSGSKG